MYRLYQNLSKKKWNRILRPFWLIFGGLCATTKYNSGQVSNKFGLFEKKTPSWFLFFS